MKNHLLNVVVLVGIVTAATLALLKNIPLAPVQASAEGAVTDWLFGLHINVIAFLFALIMVFMLYSVFVFRREPGSLETGEYFHGNTPLEIVWTIAPLITVLYFGYLGAVTLKDITSPGQNELVVNVTGSQWAWKFEYPDSGLTSNTLVLPVGRTVKLEMTSLDVIHSFWVPEFRVKQDLLPGVTKTLRVTPTLPGEYKLRCAEICGRDHAYMVAPVQVLSASAYEAWVNSQVSEAQAAESAPPAERGKTLAQVQGCLACHSADGSPGNGPTWAGLYGEEITLADGTTVTADDAYLKTAIVDPGAQIAEGFPNIMPPTYGDVLSEEQIADIIAYIKSLNE